jgi:hypothetical protein
MQLRPGPPPSPGADGYAPVQSSPAGHVRPHQSSDAIAAATWCDSLGLPGTVGPFDCLTVPVSGRKNTKYSDAAFTTGQCNRTGSGVPPLQLGLFAWPSTITLSPDDKSQTRVPKASAVLTRWSSTIVGIPSRDENNQVRVVPVHVVQVHGASDLKNATLNGTKAEISMGKDLITDITTLLSSFQEDEELVVIGDFNVKNPSMQHELAKALALKGFVLVLDKREVTKTRSCHLYGSQQPSKRGKAGKGQRDGMFCITRQNNIPPDSECSILDINTDDQRPKGEYRYGEDPPPPDAFSDHVKLDMNVVFSGQRVRLIIANAKPIQESSLKITKSMLEDCIEAFDFSINCLENAGEHGRPFSTALASLRVEQAAYQTVHDQSPDEGITLATLDSLTEGALRAAGGYGDSKWFAMSKFTPTQQQEIIAKQIKSMPSLTEDLKGLLSSNMYNPDKDIKLEDVVITYLTATYAVRNELTFDAAKLVLRHGQFGGDGFLCKPNVEAKIRNQFLFHDVANPSGDPTLVATCETPPEWLSPLQGVDWRRWFCM